MLYVAITIVLLLGVWEVVALLMDNSLLLPTFSKSCVDLWNNLTSAHFYISFSYKLLRTFISLVIAGILAVALKALSAYNAFLRTFCESIVSILRSFPTIAIILFLLLWTNNQIAPIIICILVVMPIVYAGLKGLKIDEKTNTMAKIFEIKGADYFKFVMFPHLQKIIVPLLASSIALNLKIMVASEVLACTYHSLGGMMQTASVYFDMGNLLALAFITIVTAILLEKLVGALKLLHFKVKEC